MKRLAELLRDPQFRTDVGNNARDFLQSASNTAASNVTAPVDGLAWLLRRAGVPVPQAPLGGSDWAQNAGLMAEPKNKTSLASLLGEAAGNIAPIAGYAKAPEIAGGINQMIRNANAPDTLNKGWHGQRGAINIKPNPFNVFHGSKEPIDKFQAGRGITAEHIYTSPHANDAAEYGQYIHQAQASPKKMIDFSGYEKLDKPTLAAMKKAAKDAGITDKYHTFDDFLGNAMDGQLYQYYGGQSTQNGFLRELFGKYDAVKMPDAASGGRLSESVVFENPSLLEILSRNGQNIP